MSGRQKRGTGRRNQRPVPIPQRHEHVTEHRELHRHEHSIELYDRRLFPSAQEVDRYEQILSGAADRIFTRWEQQSEHRMQLERDIVRGTERRLNWGLAVAAALSFGSIAGGVGLVLAGHTEAGVALAAPATLGSLVRVFMQTGDKSE